MPINANTRKLLLLFPSCPTPPFPFIFSVRIVKECAVGFVFDVVLWKLAISLEMLSAVGGRLRIFFCLVCPCECQPDRSQKITFYCVCAELLFLKLVMCNMSVEQRVMPTEMYFLYPVLYNLLLLIHYSSAHSGGSPMANSRGKFAATREIISALAAIWRINQETYQVPFFCLSQVLTLHGSSNPVPVMYIHHDPLWVRETDLPFMCFRWLSKVVRRLSQVLLNVEMKILGNTGRG